MQQAITIDLETTADGPDNSPEAHWPQNKMILVGYKVKGERVHTSDTYIELLETIKDHLDVGNRVLLVGHNLKFDLKYLIRDNPEFPWYKLDYNCTMYNEYRLSGHTAKFESLESALKERGIKYTKSLDLGALIKKGVKVQDIPKDKLTTYLMDDVQLTRALWLEQVKEGVYYDSNHILPLAHMELNGLLLDRVYTKRLMKNLVLDMDKLEKRMSNIVFAALKYSDGRLLQPGDLKVWAPRTISYLLTGHPRKFLVNKKEVTFCSGWECALSDNKITEVWGNKQPSNLGLPMNESVLSKLSGMPFVDSILEYRKLSKLRGTYIGPFLEKTKDIPTIHSKMNMVVTATGRLSSSDPNGQNYPPEAKELFVAEYDRLIDIDFSQLEIVAAATITKDKQLIEDLNNGEDIHYNVGQTVFGWKDPSDMTEKSRRLVKNIVFGVLYGGTAAGLSHQTGEDKSLITKIINAFYGRYPGIPKWQEEFYTEVCNGCEVYDVKDGEQRYKSSVVLPVSERLFTFIEKASPAWLKAKTGRSFSFKPTETKNYPLQGFAGGDIVMGVLYELYCLLMSNGVIIPWKIRMSVHDSILIDTSYTKDTINSFVKRACHTIEQRFNIPCKLNYTIKEGKYWK